MIEGNRAMGFDCHAHWISPRLAELLRQRQTAPRIERGEEGERFVGVHGD